MARMENEAGAMERSKALETRMADQEGKEASLMQELDTKQR